MSYQTLLIEKSDGVGILTLNRPQKKNAMNPQLHEDMTAALEELRYDDGVRVLIITGAGDTFCAGMDLKEVFYELQDQPARYDRIIRLATEWRGRTLRYYPKPTIAMVNGYCFGGAFSIVEGCDLATAADNATFGLSEINFKGFPGGSVSKTLANLFRPRDALFYGMTGRRFDGKTAANIGFVNLAFPAAQLREETVKIAREIAGKDPSALRTTKEAYRFSLEMTWEASMNFTNAKEEELQHRQRVGWKQEGVGDFVKGKFKPGLEGHETIGRSHTPKRGRLGHEARVKASALAHEVVDQLTDSTAPEEEQQKRKRKLIHGPREFRDVRQDQHREVPGSKGKR